MLDDQKTRIQTFGTLTWETAAALLFQHGILSELLKLAFCMILLHFFILATLQEKPATE
jgi:hypothetical protein